MTASISKDSNSLNLYQKLAAITGEVGPIGKDGRNMEQKFAFIEYAAVAGQLRGLFAKYGVIVIPSMPKVDDQRRVEVTSKYGNKGWYVLIDFSFKVLNADKPDEFFEVTWTGEAMDYGDKASNKAATGALKYYLMRQFNISEKGDDPDAVSPDAVVKTEPVVVVETEPIDKTTASASKLQKARITAALRGAGIADEQFASVVAASYGMELGALTVADADRLLQSLKSKPPVVQPEEPVAAATDEALEAAA